LDGVGIGGLGAVLLQGRVSVLGTKRKNNKEQGKGQGARTGLSGCYSLELKVITRLGLLILIRNRSACSWGRRNSGAM
jgi:hypothetical protein